MPNWWYRWNEWIYFTSITMLNSPGASIQSISAKWIGSMQVGRGLTWFWNPLLIFWKANHGYKVDDLSIKTRKKMEGIYGLISIRSYLKSITFPSDVLWGEAQLDFWALSPSLTESGSQNYLLWSRNRIDSCVCEGTIQGTQHFGSLSQHWSREPKIHLQHHLHLINSLKIISFFRDCGEDPKKNVRSGKPQHIWCSSFHHHRVGGPGAFLGNRIFWIGLLSCIS